MNPNRVLSIVLVAVALTGCFGSGGPTVAPHVTADQQASAGSSMGIAFPPETRFLLYHRVSEERSLLPTPDDCVHLKVDVPSVVAETLLDQEPFASAQWQSTRRHVDDVPAWSDWSPSQVRRFRSAQIELPQATFLNVLIDHDGEDTTVLYLVWHET